MSLILGLGSNQGDQKKNFEIACSHLEKISPIISKSNIYKSKAVDYTDQPDFYNQVIELALPTKKPTLVMDEILKIELLMGRVRDIDKGPRIIDIDIIFWGLESINEKTLTVPHPSWNKRSFVVKPLQELPFFKTLEKCFKMPTSFDVQAIVIE